MAEITDSAFRTMAFRGGADRCTTEMVSAAGLVRDSRNTAPLLERLPEESGETWVQHYGRDPAEMEEAARIVSGLGRFAGIDLNAGCPAPKVLRCGAGAALLEDPPLVGRLVAAAVRGAGALPVSVKTRVGPDPSRPVAAELARIAEGEGAACVALHGRYASARHSGPCDWERVAEAVAAVRIPVFANGGVGDPATALETLRRTGCAGLMPGRGAVGNPGLFAAIRRALETGEAPPSAPAGGRALAPLSETLALAREHVRLSLALKRRVLERCPGMSFDPDAAALADFRRHVFVYFRGRSGVSALRAEMGRVRTVRGLLDAVAAIFGA